MSPEDLRYQAKLAARAAGTTTVTVHPVAPAPSGTVELDAVEARYQAKLAARAAAAKAPTGKAPKPTEPEPEPEPAPTGKRHK